MEEEKTFMKHPWTRKAWKERRKNILNNKKCYYCGARENLVIHHVDYLKGNYENYQILKRQEFCDYIILCQRCHFILHRYGKHLCMRCKKKYTKYEECLDCHRITEKESEEEMQEFEEEENKWFEENEKYLNPEMKINKN